MKILKFLVADATVVVQLVSRFLFAACLIYIFLRPVCLCFGVDDTAGNAPILGSARSQQATTSSLQTIEAPEHGPHT